MTPGRGSITEQIYLETRAQILFGRYAPGDILVSKPLQQLYGCGLMSTLDALNALVVEGYVEPQPRNFAVRLWTSGALNSLFAIFANLQSLALTRTLERAPDKALKTLAQDVEAVVAKGADLDQLLAAHLLFHDRLIRLSGVVRLPELAARLVPPAFHRRLWASLVPLALPSAHWSCEAVARSLADRDLDASLALLKQQILHPRSVVLTAADAAERRARSMVGLERCAKVERFKPDHAGVGLGRRGTLLSCENLPWGVTQRDHPELLRAQRFMSSPDEMGNASRHAADRDR